MRDNLNDLSAFAVVAEERSFTRAATRLGVTQSALSHTIRGLERRLGLQLLARTTRSVSATAAGKALLEDLAPALERIEQSLAAIQHLTERPAGRLRLIMPRTAVYLTLMPKLAEFSKAYPEITLDVTTSNDLIDVVAGNYDAGIQIGEFIQRDMIAVRVSADMRLAVVGSPAYFQSRKPPRNPNELKDHACIGFRFTTGMYRWEFEKGRKSMTVNPAGPASFDDPDLVIDAVLKGMGIGTSMEDMVQTMIDDGRLVQVLREWCPVFPGFFLYYPSRRNQSAALAALIEALRYRK